MKKMLLGAVGVVVIGIASSGALLAEEAQSALDSSVDQLRAALGEKGSFKYGSAEIVPAAHSTVLHDVILHTPDGQDITAESVHVTTDDDKLALLAVDKVKMVTPTGPVEVGHIEIKDLVLPTAKTKSGNFDVASLAFSKFDVTGILGKANGQSVGIRAIHITDFEKDQGGTLSIEGFEFAGKDVDVDSVAVSKISASGVDFPTVLAAAAAHRQAVLAPGTRDAAIEGVAVAKGGRHLFDMTRLAFHDEEPREGEYNDHVTVDGAVFQPEEQYAGPLKDLGYSAAAMAMDIASTYRAEGGLLEVSKFSIKFKDMGEINLLMKLSHVPSDYTQDKLMESATDIRLGAATIAYSDSGLMPRYVNAEAQKSKVSEQQIRDGLIAQISAMIAMFGVPMGDQLNLVAKTFIGHPGTIRIVAAPDKPLAVTEIMALGQTDQKALTDRLKLAVTAE